MSGKVVNITNTEMESFRVELLEADEPADEPTKIHGVDLMFGGGGLLLAFGLLASVWYLVGQFIH